MVSKEKNKLKNSLKQLKEAVDLYQSNESEMAFLSLAKAFEVAVEYAWKELKQRVEDEGLEVFSPKDAMRKAAQTGFITDPELWLDFVKTRNSSVHDYFEIPDEDYFTEVKKFLKEARRLFDKH